MLVTCTTADNRVLTAVPQFESVNEQGITVMAVRFPITQEEMGTAHFFIDVLPARCTVSIGAIPDA